MVLATWQPKGSKKAMRCALESVRDYIEGQRSLQEHRIALGIDPEKWWPPMQATINEVMHALGETE